MSRAGRHSSTTTRAVRHSSTASRAGSYSNTTSRAARHSYGNGNGNRSRLLYIGAAAAVLVFACWWLWLRPGTAGTAPTEHLGGFPTFEQSAPVAKGGKGLIETFEVFAPKDPFAPAAGKGSSGPDGGTHRVRLVGTGSGSARLDIDGTVHSISRGRVFAGSFKLVSTSGRCATFLYGDDQFSLCRGEEVTK